MSVITITLIFFYAAFCVWCRKIKENGQIDIIPGIIVSACISFTAILIASGQHQWTSLLQPATILLTTDFYAYYLLYDTVQIVGENRKHNLNLDDFVAASLLFWLDLLSCLCEYCQLCG